MAQETKKATFDEQSQVSEAREKMVEDFASEMDYLVGKKLLPPVAAEFKNADWSDAHVAKQPGVKEQIALLNYMVKENEVRAKAGVKQLASVVDAFNACLPKKEDK
mgnify:CR=1 FL=1